MSFLAWIMINTQPGSLMILIIGFYLGFVFGISGMFGKRINSMHGRGFANQGMQLYCSILGFLSNLILPLGAAIVCFFIKGGELGLIFSLLMFLGACLAGLIFHRNYFITKFFSVFGIPIGAAAFFIALYQ